MADNILTKLVALIHGSHSLELRRGAVRVAGSIASGKERALVQELLLALNDADGELRCAAIDALGRLRVDEALPRLEQFIRQGGEELESAVLAASHLGRGARLVSRLMDEATPALRSRMAAALAKSGTGSALVVTAHALLDDDPKVVEAAARSLAAEVPHFNAGQRQPLAKFLMESLQGKAKRPPNIQAALIRVLGTLHHPSAEKLFWSRLAPGFPHDVRLSALQALGQPRSLAGPRLQILLACAADADFQIVASALMILKNVPLGKNLKPWLKLLQAPDVAAHRFAVEKLAGLKSKDWARALVAQLEHPDRALRDEVLKELCSFDPGRNALLEKLLAAADPEESWALARTLAGKLEKASPAQRQNLLKRASAYQDQADRRAAPLWFLLRKIDPQWTRGQLEQKAESLRKKKKYPEALTYYGLLSHDPACDDQVRFDMAATGLKVSPRDLAPEARQNDPALKHFAQLLQNPDFDALARLRKAKWLEAPELFYLGFHFIEHTQREKEFGKNLLEWVLKRFPRSEQAKTAKRKLQSEE